MLVGRADRDAKNMRVLVLVVIAVVDASRLFAVGRLVVLWRRVETLKVDLGVCRREATRLLDRLRPSTHPEFRDCCDSCLRDDEACRHE